MICHLPRVNLRRVDRQLTGDSISFEVSALSNDLVDDISTMFPTVHYSPSIGMWSGDWVTDIAIVGAGDNARFSFEIDTPLDAELGNYDVSTVDDRPVKLVIGLLRRRHSTCKTHSPEFLGTVI